ncbi:hypothetical protein [Arundinibacter roseus]|uniref:Uncharacterized protein n=1 Tax=Arundinibacter roseus TaxID=2070510 RepID=A0A4R4KLE0_9BACT|nr:hypothetical protein [Arundinibacter roseus]TDB67549.1 hypothetical protein EZE20_06285 [Arundinibacter roseus]
MKAKAIKFFSPEDNVSVTEKVKQKKEDPEGYVSPTGKLVIPLAALTELGIEPEETLFKIGAQQGKTKLKFLYLIPTTETEGSFALQKTGRGFSIPLENILKKGRVDYQNVKYIFTISMFNYQEGVVGYELALASTEPKAPYTGKPRGRKRKEVTEG